MSYDECELLTGAAGNAIFDAALPVDAWGDFVLMCDYTGKEVVE